MRYFARICAHARSWREFAKCRFAHFPSFSQSMLTPMGRHRGLGTVIRSFRTSSCIRISQVYRDQTSCVMHRNRECFSGPLPLWEEMVGCTRCCGQVCLAGHFAP